MNVPKKMDPLINRSSLPETEGETLYPLKKPREKKDPVFETFSGKGISCRSLAPGLGNSCLPLRTFQKGLPLIHRIDKSQDLRHNDVDRGRNLLIKV